MGTVKNISKLNITLFLGALLLITFFLVRSGRSDDEVITNDDVYRTLNRSVAFQKSHSIMSQQSDTLTAITKGFLTGDTNMINHKSDELLAAMKQMLLTYMPEEEDEADTWQPISKIVEETREMKKDLAAEDFDKAYGHLSVITASCIRCHQVARDWGKFPAPPPAKKEPPQP